MDEAKRATKAVTLTQHILLTKLQKFPNATGGFTTLLHAIEIASKFVSSKVRAAGLFRLQGEEGSINVQGENVKKLDVIANEAFITALTRSRQVSLMVSEENSDPVIVAKEMAGDYVAVFDPLDGSSNIDVNISIGTIFGIYQRTSGIEEERTVSDALRPGKELVAAGYTMYGSATMLVLTLSGGGVNGFTLDPSTGEFVLSHPLIKIPSSHPIYSVNEGNQKHWHDNVKDFVESIKESSYSLRYVGSMVADVHRTLIYGGIFMYPADKQSTSGKLRLLYEANPMALIVEQAGGLAIDGKKRILDIVPTAIHQRTGVIMGSKEEVEKFLLF